MATAINKSPEVPLESATGWLEEMERRYRIAGYSERPVRESELWFADSIGDDERAERAYARWQAADRDDMSDCHACELNGQGHYAMLRGDDARALEVWQPVLAGDKTCAEEPHRVLAIALLPLLRLGRLDEARTQHLRGYRLARGKESLLPSIGKHIEFCALTGNEPRGLEILAEHAAHVGPLANVDDQLAFHGGILVLLRRLKELGHGQSPAVPYEGIARTVSELYEVLRAGALDIARRFDARNGTTRVSDRLLDRIGQAPLADVLPLGVRSTALPMAAPAAPVAAPVAAPAGADFAELVERARAARDLGHPGADALWAEVAVRVEARPEGEVDPLVSADVADHRALAAARGGAADAAELLAAARDDYQALGQAERAALAELRLASAAAQSGAEPGEIRELLGVALRAAEALDAGEPLRTRRIALAELSAIRLESYLRSVEAVREPECGDGHGHGHGHADDHERGHGHGELSADLTAFVSAYGETLPDLVAEAEEMLGRVALSQGDPERATPLLASAAARGVAAGRPWQAVDPLVLRAGVLLSLGRPEEAEEAARSGLEHAAEVTDAEQQGVVRLTLADILLRRAGAAGEAAAEAAEEAAQHALTAAHWFDQAGLTTDSGSQARLLLARAYARLSRNADAAEVIQSTLSDLLEHGEQQAVSVREFLGDLLRELNEPRAAAEQYLLAAEAVKGWEDPRPQASFAQSAADQLSEARLTQEAVAAYERSLELHRVTGDAPVSEARILRSLAWLALREEVTNATVARARALMDEATAVLEAALAGTPEAPELRSELAQTWHQLAQVLDRRVNVHEQAAYEDGSDGDGDEDEDEDGNGDEDGGVAAGGGSGPAESLSEAEIEALRLEEVLLWDRAAGVYADLGPAHLQDRFQCLNNAAWTEQELGRAEVGAARISALVDEIRAWPEDAVPDWVLPRAERIIENLTA
ncbi:MULTISPECIES: tetratricopeptide repeat protein [unclassified Streptomyces]|uniref:tetratricopeptide repeat protein n=1 Tax=unclassified Streptomyces TaxID=2593676 RepID=UPI001BE8D6B0|nr:MULTISPECIES: tetratricopeptide repeat protein [unclassified Streptomyces]MBT2402793.1 tetratricopeptide repeat protein [Streptomyces sp. ISL-21]MBT2607249.1 tetratricopeptide repeat protein [Streptomyces sp. ISL-87]